MKHKNIFTLLIILISVLLLSSCGNTVPETDNTKQQTEDIDIETIPAAPEPEVYSDLPINQYVIESNAINYYNGGLYLFKGMSSSSAWDPSQFIRYSLETGNTVFVCPDPLCMHDTEDCPFTGRINVFFIRDNKIYYDRRIHFYKNREPQSFLQYCCYDLKTMNLTVMAEKDPRTSNGKTTKQLLYKDYWYFYDLAYDLEAETSRWVIQRLNLKKGKIEQVGNKDGEKINENGINVFAEQFLFILNDRIYFTDTQSIYSTTLDLEDKKVHIKGSFISNQIYTDGTYIYYAVPEWDTENPTNEYVLHLYRMDLKGKNVLDLEIRTLTGLWMLTDNYIYYQTPHRLLIPNENPIQQDKAFRTDAFYRCAHDGSGKEQFFTLQSYKEGTDTPSQAINLRFFTVANDHVYGIYELWEDKNGNGKMNSDTEFDNQLAFNNPHAQGVKVLDIDVVNGTHSFIEIE